MTYLIPFLLSLIVSFILTAAIRKFSLRFNILDNPNSERKIHKHPIPLLGGLGIFLSFWILISAIILFTDILPARYISSRFLCVL